MKKVIFLLVISLFLSGCSLASNGQNSQSNVLTQQVKDLQGQLAQLQSDYNFLQQTANKNELTSGDLLYKSTATISCYQLGSYKKFNEVYPDFDLTKIDSASKALLEKGDVYEICETDRGNKAFLMYGEFGKENNVIGILIKNLDNNEYKLVMDKKYNKPMGDIGTCRINGFIERNNLVYSCGGGDAGLNFNTVYVLNSQTGKSKVVKSCTNEIAKFPETEMTCDIN